MRTFRTHSLVLLFTLAGILPLYPQDKRNLEITDLMKFRQIRNPSISDNGEWAACSAVPDRGDPEALVYSTDGKMQYTVPLGKEPVFSGDGHWVAAIRAIPADTLLNPDPKLRKKAKEGLVLLELSGGEQITFPRVRSFRFSNDSRWLVFHQFEEPDLPDSLSSFEKNTPLVIRSLTGGTSRHLPFVKQFALDSTSRYLAAAVADTLTKEMSLQLWDLKDPGAGPLEIWRDSGAWVDNLTWNNRDGSLAFLAGATGKKEKRLDAGLYLWIPGDPSSRQVLTDGDLADQWRVYTVNRLRWSVDGNRLFLGTKPGSEIFEPGPEQKDTLFSLYDTSSILNDRGVDVWHWEDPYINSNQKERWKREKDRTYTGVYYPQEQRFVQLATPGVPDVRVSESATCLLGISQVPYAIRSTWEGRIMDCYLVDLKTGEQRPVLKEQLHQPTLSPDGKYLVYFREGDWHLLQTDTGSDINLTGALQVPFADEDWDYPEDTPGYGLGGWLDGSDAVFIYDKYDIWQFNTSTGEALCITEGTGREQRWQFRIRKLEEDKKWMESGEKVFVTGDHEMKKHTAVFSMTAGKPGVEKLVEEPAIYRLIAMSKKGKHILFSRESYSEFPDLRVAGPGFKQPLRLSDVNPQMAGFAWGEAELVEWNSLDGIPLQGVLIKPGNYEPGKRYPVLVYYYRIFSNRLYEFNDVVVNHRPCFPFYTSNGYAIFLPDIRFDIGTPGYSATKCLVPGVQKLIDMGVADPDAVALHGHSWSGYQTAFVITQTDLFACAIAGAPVSNMTSAYSGIRWESGLARQFQYEKGQSRIGGSLWEARDKYIENSPVFFADRIHTPLLIEFGDKDGAVPWYQGIELYLAMRRLGKPCVMLEYRDEPHHLQKYPNKLDYTLKFKAYLDHYLKGEPAPEWLREGIPYRGE